MAAQLRFAKLHQKQPQTFWNNILWTDETKVEMFVIMHKTPCLPKTKHSVSLRTVKHGGGTCCCHIVVAETQNMKHFGITVYWVDETDTNVRAWHFLNLPSDPRGLISVVPCCSTSTLQVRLVQAHWPGVLVIYDRIKPYDGNYSCDGYVS